MYMIPFCKIFLLLIYSVKPECKKKKKIKKIIFKFEQHFAMRYLFSCPTYYSWFSFLDPDTFIRYFPDTYEMYF